MIRVLIADDDHLMRAGLIELLTADPEIQIIGQASTGREAVLRTRQLSPDVVLMDVRMPDLDGIAATRELSQADPAVKVLELITRGLSNREIAAALIVEESTIRTHVKRILMKLGLRDRDQAVIFSYENGLNRPR